MKKTLTAVLCVLLALTLLCSCGGAKKTTFGIGEENIEKYVVLGQYKGITVNTKSEEYKTVFESIVAEDATKNNCYNRADSGAVQEGDIANIDYVGKIDGVAFEGGTANGYDLKIGSGSFITGFEDGLIGVTVGETTDLFLKFPDDYRSCDLAGRNVVFTVKVNYRQTTQTYEQFYQKLGFKSANDYKKDLTQRAVKEYTSQRALYNAKQKSIINNETVRCVVTLKYYEYSTMQAYGVTINEYLAANNITFDRYVETLKSTVTIDEIISDNLQKGFYDREVTYYAIYLAEDDIKIDSSAFEDESDIERAFSESKAVEKAVTDFLCKTAKIK